MDYIWDTKRKKYFREDEIFTPNEIKELHARKRKALYAQDKKWEEREQDRLRRGYCPKCHLALPLSGECGCGYKKPISTTPTISKSNHTQYKNYVNPAILEMYK